MNNPHTAIAPILEFLKEYYTQVDRLLSDVTHHLIEADPPWQRLRRLGEAYESGAEVKVGHPERFLVQYLGHWYAPASAFNGSSYGAASATVSRLAFAGVWMGDKNNPPELYAGWIEGMTWVPDKVIETHLKQFNSWPDPDESTPPQELTTLEAVVFDSRPLRWDKNGARLAMARVPLAEINSPKALATFTNRWLAALAAPTP